MSIIYFFSPYFSDGGIFRNDKNVGRWIKA